MTAKTQSQLRSPDLGAIAGLPEKFGRDFALELFRRANFAHHFERKVKQGIDSKVFTIPIYLSFGTEFNAAALSMVCPEYYIFAQHRCHSIYLCFGGEPEGLRDELLGLPTGCANGMSGSNAIHCPDVYMFGHSGLMGEQIPIAVGAAYGSNHSCLAICGDASVEEDYIYPSLGWAATKKLPVLFICEDNNLSILTKVDVRRTWNPASVAGAVGMTAVDIADDPWLIAHHVGEMQKSLPGFINIRTVRKLWHAGAGTDGPPEWDRYELVVGQLKKLGLEKDIAGIDKENSQRAAELWDSQLQKR